MYVNIKKMLSLFVVLAMVIGMVPAVGLPAVVAKADTTQSINEQAKAMTFTGGTDHLYCPVCDDEVDWLPLTEGGKIPEVAANTHAHYYAYDADKSITLDTTTNAAGTSTWGVFLYLSNSNAKVCLNLNNHEIIAPCGLQVANSTNALNIMGEGRMVYTNSAYNSYSRHKALLYVNNGSLSLYGGTYYDMNTTDARPTLLGGTSTRVTLNVYEDAKVFGITNLPKLWKVNLYDNAFIQNLQISDTAAVQDNAAVTVDSSFTGRVWNLSFPMGIAEDGTIATGKVTTFTGNITTADGKKVEAVDGALKVTTAYTEPTAEAAFDPDAFNGKAWCTHCGAVKNWVPYFGNNAKVLQDSSGVYHFHIYLTEDVVQTTGATNGSFIHSFENICLNLNGYNVTTAGRAMRCTQTLAIMGDSEKPGTITAGKIWSGDGAIAKNMKEFYLYDGVNVATTAGDTSPAISCAGNIYLNGGNIAGTVSDKEAAATISLANGASADLIKLTNAASKLSVAAGWSGEAVVQLPAALENGVVPAANGVALGNFSGKLTTSDGARLFHVNGGLATTPTFDPSAATNYCIACGDDVAWTALPATEADMDLSTGKHYYVPQDMTFTGSNGWLFRMSSRAVLCLNLNGKTLTLSGTRIYNGEGGSTVNIIGAGGTLQGTHSKGLFYSDTGNTHLYGGTYLASGTLGVEPNTNGSQYHLHGNAKLEGTVSLDIGKLHLYDQAVADTIALSGTGLVTFHEGWTGSAVLDVDGALVTNNTVSTDNAVVEGALTGTLTTADGFEISLADGKLLLAQPAKDVFDPVSFGGKAYCSVCDDIVDWVDYNAHVAENGYYDNDHKLNASGVPTHHFYLSEDITYTTQLLSLNDKLHFNFNGCDVTATGDTATTAFRITQQAHFLNTGDVATVTGGITGATVGAVLENGGNVNVPNESDTYIYGNIVMTTLPGCVGPAVNMGSETNVLTVSGKTVIESLNLGTTDSLVDISGLTEGSSVALAGLTVGQIFTVACDNVDDVKGYISSLDIVGPFGIVAKQMTVKAEAGIVSGGEVVWHGDNADAVLAYTEQNFADGAYIVLSDEETLTLAGGNYYVDIAGKNLAVSGTGKLYPIDSANDDFEGFGQWTYEDVEIARDVTFGDNRYVTITVDGTTSTHRLEMKLKSVSLRTSAAGLYYNAQYRCDATLAEQVSAYGVILSLKDMPGAELASGDKRTVLTNFAPNANHTVSATSCSVFGIFKDTRTAEKNAEYGKMKIYANAYIQLNLDGAAELLVADNENVGKQAGTAWSLYDVLKAIDQNWADYADDQENIKAFFEQWYGYGMSDYADDFENIDEIEVNDGEGTTPEDTDMDAAV